MELQGGNKRGTDGLVMGGWLSNGLSGIPTTVSGSDGAGLRVCPHLLGQQTAVADAVTIGLVAAELVPTSLAAAEAGRVAEWIIEDAGSCQSART